MTDYEQEHYEELEDIQINGQHFVKTKQRERLIRKGRKRQNNLRKFVRFFLSIGMILALVYLSQCKGWYMDKQAFNYVGGNSLEIINNKIVPSYKILAILKNSNVPNVPIYLAKTNDIKNELMKLTPIENVYIRRYAFPARMQIIIRERVPVITISPDAKVKPVAFFTSDGKLIGREYLPLPKDYKTLLVLSYGNKGDDYHKWDLLKIRKIMKIANYVSTYSHEPIEYIDFRNPNDVYVKIKTVNIRLGVLDETVFKRIERIPSILPQVKLVDSKVKYLDLRWEKVNYLKLE